MRFKGAVKDVRVDPARGLSLSAMLDLWIYAKTDRWLAMLIERGLEEAADLPRRSWTVKREDFSGAPELVEAVTAAAERLTLKLT